MTYAADATTVTPAGIYAVGSMGINLPPGVTTTVASPHCTLGKQYNVFAVQPHMHQLGTKIVFQHGTSEATMQPAYQRDPWVFGVQPIDQVDDDPHVRRLRRRHLHVRQHDRRRPSPTARAPRTRCASSSCSTRRSIT